MPNDLHSIKPKNGFFHSNLFIFLLGQAFAFVCWLVIVSFGWGKYSERFEGIDKRVSAVETTQKRMDEHGTNFMGNLNNALNGELGELKGRVQRVESETAHFDVMEAENRRLTKDVEDLKSGKK